MAAPPLIYGKSDRAPRGDYARARSDYTCEQNHALYSPADHDTWRTLYARQTAMLAGLASQRFIDLLPQLAAGQGIPRFADINARLKAATDWEIVAVPGLIPELPFFSLLSQRKFPVTDWIRSPQELDYIVEPDVFHDLFGHVPLLFDTAYADHIQAYGAGALKAYALEQSDPSCKAAVEHLSRLYWYTIEFGLLREEGAIKAFGAGILSSAGELAYSVRSANPQRLQLSDSAQLLHCMASSYTIDSFQSQYFVIESFAALLSLTAPDFTPYYRQLASASSQTKPSP